MFLRKWSSLPEDPVFPSDLKGLGYFINKDDEIRSIENEDNYFKYFIDRNPRICDRQRFSMNQAIQDEVHKRLTDLGLRKLFFPVCTSAFAPSKAKLPIFMSADITKKARVVVIFGETHQGLGVLAHRVLGGKGGIDQGSLVSVVKALLQEQSSPTIAAAATAATAAATTNVPGIILANMGELIWWPQGNRTLSRFAFDWAPMRSAAHIGNYIDPDVNRVPGNETPAAHVKYIFETVIPLFVNASAGLDIIGLGDGADVVESYLNNDATWARVGGRLNCFASVGGQFPSWEVECEGLREFLKDRARAYVPSTEPLGLILSGPDGNPHTTTFTSLGCPVFSAGESHHVETLFIASHPTVLDWLQEVADAPKERPYKNPIFSVVYSDGAEESNNWAGWQGEEEKEEEEDKDNTDEANDNKGDGAGAGELKIVTKDDMAGIDGTDGDEVTQKVAGEHEQVGAQKEYVLRPKRSDGGGDVDEGSKATKD